jgi:hypothetical protein
MSLADDLTTIMKQTSTYKEETPSNIEDINKEISDTSNNESVKEDDNPFKKISLSKILTNPKMIMSMLGIIILIIMGIIFIPELIKEPEDTGAEFLEDLDITTYKYSLEEKSLMRIAGYTADEIERYEIEERDPYELIKEVEIKRKEQYETDIKPLFDSASDEYKFLMNNTWVGGKDILPDVITTKDSNYNKSYGTYNCDYRKIPAKGSQLFLKLYIVELNSTVFMSITPERYSELNETGNIVVTLYFNEYSDGSIIVTEVSEKEI